MVRGAKAGHDFDVIVGIGLNGSITNQEPPQYEKTKTEAG
jgi:hypothetical protein